MSVRPIVLHASTPELLHRGSEPRQSGLGDTRQLLVDLKGTLLHHSNGVTDWLLLRASPATLHSGTSPQIAEKFREKTLFIDRVGRPDNLYPDADAHDSKTTMKMSALVLTSEGPRI